ncbi:MAG TPA: helicase HerA-like domain-containing protein, partial [Trebonia sp.]|nr:helicase HerA-like domain-containing protein [Trebonia sp.]
GTVLDGSRLPAGPFAVPLDSVNRHVFVCGATGSGKSQTVRNILEALTAAGIPWLVIEPAKAEYRRMAARIPDHEVIVIRPGDPDAVAAGINPLEPATGPDGARYPLQVHADLVRGLFLAAFQAEEPFPQVLAQALDRVYREAGWDMVSGEPAVEGAAYPGLGDLQAAAMAVIDDIGYGKEVRDNIRGFVAVRVGSLQSGTTGRFLSGRFPVDFGKLVSGNVVLEVEDAGDDMDKAFLIGCVLVRLSEFLRLRDRAEAARKTHHAGEPGPADSTGKPGETEGAGQSRVTGLRHVTVIEEAHRLLRQPPEGAGAGAAAKAVEMFADVLAEIRAYGEGIVIAEQIPTKLIVDAIKNTAVKLMHRLPARDDRDAVGASMNMGEAESAFVTTLLPGEAAAFADGMDFPVLVRLPDGSGRENAGGRAPAVPDRLVTASRPGCPQDCAERACTLRALSSAARTVDKDQRITLWAELTVAAHLTGRLMPVPRAALARDLKAMDRRHRDCALAAAVEAAVAARVPVLSARIAGPELAAHCAAAMRALLDDNKWVCAGSEPEWTAPAFLWDRILRRLHSYERERPGRGPHPSTAEWEQGSGDGIPGATCAQQIAVVQQRHAAARKDPRAVRTVLLGNRSPSALENAVGGTAADPAWRDRLATSLTVLASSYDWAQGLLAAPGEQA